MQITEKFEIVPVEKVTPDARSARKHGGEQIRELFAFAHSSLCFT